MTKPVFILNYVQGILIKCPTPVIPVICSLVPLLALLCLLIWKAVFIF